jgi:hypothetical protein
MQHKTDQDLNHPNQGGSQINNESIKSHISDAKLPHSNFKDYLKSKVHRPHVTPEFIQNIKRQITKE